jgi:hypothetical protein
MGEELQQIINKRLSVLDLLPDRKARAAALQTQLRALI